MGEHPLSRPPLETGSRHHAKAKTTLGAINMQSLAFSFRRGKTSSIRGAFFFIGLTFQGEHTVFLMAAFQPLHFFLDTKKTGLVRFSQCSATAVSMLSATENGSSNFGSFCLGAIRNAAPVMARMYF